MDLRDDRVGDLRGIPPRYGIMTAGELSQIVSFLVGALASIAFVMAFKQRW